MNWDLSGRKSLPKGGKNQGPNLWSPHRFKPLSGVRVRLVASGCVAAHSIVVTEEGKAFSFGKCMIYVPIQIIFPLFNYSDFAS